MFLSHPATLTEKKNKTLAAARAPGDLLWLEACKYEQLKQKKPGWFRVFRG